MRFSGLTLAFLLLAARPSAEQAVVMEFPSLSYAELSAQQADYLHETISLTVQFHSKLERWNPYLTRFGSADFSAVKAWSGEQLTWNLADYDEPLVELFLRRGSGIERAFDALEQYQRMEVVVVVRELFADRPWMEVLSVKPADEQILEGTLIHASRAVRLMHRREWTLASTELDRAMEGPLPAHATQELVRLKGICSDVVSGEIQLGTIRRIDFGDVEELRRQLSRLRSEAP